MTVLKPFCTWIDRALRPRTKRSFRVSITTRLALGFFLAALIAAIATGMIGLRQVALLRAQAKFYQTLLQTNTTLTTGSDYLKAIQSQMANLLTDAAGGKAKKELIATDEHNLISSIQQYNAIIAKYITRDLLIQHPDQMGVLSGTNAQMLALQQHTYAAGALQTWYLYEASQQHILGEVEGGRVLEAIMQSRLQSEPAFADALSALHSLIQYNTQLGALSTGAATANTGTAFAMALLEALLAFAAVALVGLLISRSLVQRLKSLHHVTRAVKAGQMEARVVLQGSDEITDVSHSFNSMLDSLVTALQQTTLAREQTDLAYTQQRQLNNMKDLFIQHVSHEFRTPLTEVYGFLQLLQERQTQLDQGQQEYFIAQAIRGCEELITLCATILDVSRQSTLIQPPQNTTIYLAPLIEELISYWCPREKAEHRVDIHIPPTLAVQANPQYTRQVLRNLLSNAFKYTPANQPLSITATQPGQVPGQEQHFTVIRLKDHGPGIPLDEQRALFQQFMRLKRDVAGAVRGTGLGLYLCRQFVEAMGGQIWVESSGIPGEGSCFCFTLPLYAPDEVLTIDQGTLYSMTPT